jgi:mannan endo-1,4-beta-mannosidase
MKCTSIAALGSALAGTLVSAVPAGFVTTNGEKFSLGGEDFFFAGSNAYYFPFNVVCLLVISFHNSF